MRVDETRRVPRWALPAVTCIFWWGIWGFLAKIGSSAANPLQLQLLFTFGMLPVAAIAFWQLRFRLSANRSGATYGVLNGLFTALGLLAYYAAMERGKASIVGPVTALFPLITIVLAFFILRERLNRVQMAGMLFAICAIAIFSV